MRVALILTLVFALAALPAQAYHPACPGTPANVTLRVLDGGYYVVTGEMLVTVWEESNGHSGLQRGDVPLGCEPDTAVL